ncbi:MAG: glycine--tRNA ligase [Streptosporangiaceae bacterium]
MIHRTATGAHGTVAVVLTMQDALLRLTEYWAARGCLIAQPMNTEVGAGTLNPATALRVLGPEPWRVAYVEPSVRPDDSRYGDNPNRIQTHTQFQVILKPEPGDAQEQYLGSLTALGIDAARHDVRFVEDDWASPALGAWGLGWEVWLDGLEITQFTYFQQSGGLTLDPVSVELTYGMERILMSLQQVTHFKDIAYAPGVSYGEVFGQAEYEMSRYYLDDADIAASRVMFDTYAAEAQRLAEARLPVPAHSYVLKCSHTFNVLDARGAISTTERARAFARMRSLARGVAELWVQRREELGHPLGVATAPAPAAPRAEAGPGADTPCSLAFEIGVEEMPPAEVTRAADQVRTALTRRLRASRLGHGEIRAVASPRRIVATVADVQPVEEDEVRNVRGPRVNAAYDADGTPTKAATGFARSQGIDVADLQRLDVDGVAYVGVAQATTGRPAGEVLAEILPEIVRDLRGDKNMRWTAPGLSYTRPIRWVVALLGDRVVPFTVSTLASGRVTCVHRTATPPQIDVPSADGYLQTLRARGIVADAAERRTRIVQAAVEMAAGVGGRIDPDDAVIDEVTNLVERPTPILGRFYDDYLELPADVLATVMRKHQRYLPVRDDEDRLLPSFIAVANGDCDQDAVRVGNEAVLRARFEDAGFFWRHDLSTSLEEMRRHLDTLTFETSLGSMADRASRIHAISELLAQDIKLADDERAALARAGEFAKFDLSSQMVIELPNLAGVMAREYSRRAGEPEVVARDLYDMELPRNAGGALPGTTAGGLLSLADRVDLLVGLFAVGSAPTGRSDPYGMRRAALGVVAILLADPRLADLTLRGALAAAGRHQPVPFDERLRREAYGFVVRRLEQHLLDAGYSAVVVRAVLPLADIPARAAQTASDLTELIEEPRFRRVTQAMQRVRRILPADAPAGYDAALFTEPAEQALHQALAHACSDLPAEVSLPRFVRAAAHLVDPIDRFFTDVLVMTDDPAVRSNRLGLLASIRGLSDGVLDWSALT